MTTSFINLRKFSLTTCLLLSVSSGVTGCISASNIDFIKAKIGIEKPKINMGPKRSPRENPGGRSALPSSPMGGGFPPPGVQPPGFGGAPNFNQPPSFPGQPPAFPGGQGGFPPPPGMSQPPAFPGQPPAFPGDQGGFPPPPNFNQPPAFPGAQGGFPPPPSMKQPPAFPGQPPAFPGAQQNDQPLPRIPMPPRPPMPDNYGSDTGPTGGFPPPPPPYTPPGQSNDGWQGGSSSPTPLFPPPGAFENNGIAPTPLPYESSEPEPLSFDFQKNTTPSQPWQQPSIEMPGSFNEAGGYQDVSPIDLAPSQTHIESTTASGKRDFSKPFVNEEPNEPVSLRPDETSFNQEPQEKRPNIFSKFFEKVGIKKKQATSQAPQTEDQRLGALVGAPPSAYQEQMNAGMAPDTPVTFERDRSDYPVLAPLPGTGQFATEAEIAQSYEDLKREQDAAMLSKAELEHLIALEKEGLAPESSPASSSYDAQIAALEEEIRAISEPPLPIHKPAEPAVANVEGLPWSEQPTLTPVHEPRVIPAPLPPYESAALPMIPQPPMMPQPPMAAPEYMSPVPLPVYPAGNQLPPPPMVALTPPPMAAPVITPPQYAPPVAPVVRSTRAISSSRYTSRRGSNGASRYFPTVGLTK